VRLDQAQINPGSAGKWQLKWCVGWNTVRRCWNAACICLQCLDSVAVIGWQEGSLFCSNPNQWYPCKKQLVKQKLKVTVVTSFSI